MNIYSTRKIPTEVNIMVPWKILTMWLFECMFVTIVLSQDSPVVEFCNGSAVDTTISILYEDDNGPFNCQCSVIGRHTDLHEYVNETTYAIHSLNIKNASENDGGYFNLSFSSESNKVTILNETRKTDELIFECPGNHKTEITLVLYPDMKVPKELKIHIYGGEWILNVTCRSGLEETTTIEIIKGHASTTPTTTTTSTQTVTTSTTTSPVTTPTTIIQTSKLSTLATQSTSLPVPGSSSQEADLEQSGGVQVAPIAAGVVGSAVLVATIIAILVICLIKRKTTSGKVHKSKKGQSNPIYNATVNDTVHSVTYGNASGYNVQENKTAMYKGGICKPTDVQLDTEHNSPCHMNRTAASVREGYDHVELGLLAKGEIPGIYDHVNIDASEDCYHHLGSGTDKSVNVIVDYDTTASASKAVKDLENQDDYYSYDHLGTSNGSTETTVTDLVYDKTLTVKNL